MPTRHSSPPTAFSRLLKPAVTALADAVTPQTCPACGIWTPSHSPTALCPACARELEAYASLPYCHRCARTMPPLAIHDRDCGACRRESHWNLRRLLRLGPYADDRHPTALRELLLAVKFAGSRPAAVVLASHLAARIRAAPWFSSLDALVPVPMHWLRRMQRPAAHAQLVTELIGHRLGLPVWNIVRRRRYAPSQMEMASVDARRRNVRDCFTVRNAARLRGRTICLIDNLTLSGATICEVSRVLRAAGARIIYGAIVARSLTPGDFQASAAALLANYGLPRFPPPAPQDPAPLDDTPPT